MTGRLVEKRLRKRRVTGRGAKVKFGNILDLFHHKLRNLLSLGNGGTVESQGGKWEKENRVDVKSRIHNILRTQTSTGAGVFVAAAF